MCPKCRGRRCNAVISRRFMPAISPDTGSHPHPERPAVPLRHSLIKFSRFAPPLVLFLLLWALPVSGWAWMERGGRSAAATLAAQLLLLALYANLRAMLLREGRLRWFLRVVLNLLGALLVLLQVITLGYLLVQGFPLDPFFALDNAREAVPTLLISFSPVEVAIGGVVVLAVWGAACWALWRMPVRWPLRGRGEVRLLHGFVPLAALLLWANMAQFTLIKSLLPLLMNSSRLSDSAPTDLDVGAVTRHFRPVPIADKRPVFILQMESVNAMAIAGMGTPGMGREQLMPVLNALSGEGVFVPFMWGASMQTHRGKGSILCSAVLDVFAGVSMGAVQPTNCLGNALAAQGYRTLFFTAHSDPGFAQGWRFVTSAGFKETHFADLMRKGDVHYSWGYDDCYFYKRTFDYIDRKFGARANKNFFAYLEVTANHNPFGGKHRSGVATPFKPPQNFKERYLNSFAAEDSCLATFMERVEPYRDRAHIIFVGDHSWPVGLLGSKDAERGASAENFLIPFLYLPPRDAGEAYRRGAVITKPMLGQADITPTVLELLSGKPQSNSFAALLRARPDGAEPKLPWNYDNCQVTAQPYDGGQISVIRGDTRVHYRLDTQQLRVTQLREDFSEEAASERSKMRYRDFLEKYLCSRFRWWTRAARGDPRVVPLKIPHFSF